MKTSVLLSLGFIVFTVEAELTEEQKRRCEQLTSIFDNDSPTLDYGYVENLHNGKGFTSGRARFTTSSGDAYEVVRRYSARKPNNPLARFQAELKRLRDSSSPHVTHLTGYVVAWKRCSRDRLFRQIQDEVCDHFYYWPAMKIAKIAKLSTALGKCIIYDTILQHGNGDDPDSIKSIISRVQLTEGASVLVPNEDKWIREFLRVRRVVLQHPDNKSNLILWRESVDRVDAFLDLCNDDNWDLNGPIHVETPNHSEIIL